LFKYGIKPFWEDERNRDGGRWLIQNERHQKGDTDRFWMEVLMMLVGESFGAENDRICGAVVNIRPKADKISVWINGAQEDQIKKIGQLVKDRLKLPPNRTLTYETHQDTLSKSGSSARPTFTI
jgi:translation initiation factor 4E